jgi:hypothetical protein
MSMLIAAQEAQKYHNELASSLGKTGGRMAPVTMTGGIVIRDNANNVVYQDGGNFTGTFHVEPGLASRIYKEVRHGTFTPAGAHLYLYVYLSPCPGCKGILSRRIGALAGYASYTLGFTKYYIGKPGGWSSENEAEKAMKELKHKGWTVQRWSIVGTPQITYQL